MNNISRRDFIKTAAAAGTALFFGKNVLAVMAPAPAGIAAETPFINVHPGGKFRALAVTDLHFYLNHLVDMNTMKDIKNIIKKFNPDIIIPTGDVWHNNPGGHGIEFCDYACKEFGKLGIPWAFVWGNHDQVDDYNLAHKKLSEAANSLYRGGAADGNYRIELRDPSGSKPVWNLIMLNDSRGGMKEEQLSWLRKEATAIKAASAQPAPSFLFFHIPIRQYEDLAKSGKAKGMKLETVSFSECEESAFPSIKDTGIVKGAFCGHDHRNNYWGRHDGVFLEYVRSTGYGGYGGEQCKKGATIIDIDTNTGEFKTTTVFADGSTWTPNIFLG